MNASIVARSALLIAFAAWTGFAVRAFAAEATPTEQDPVAQARAVRLAEQLRCLVCQNQTIADSNAELAVDLRKQVREQIAAGRSDGEIIDYMTARYGDFVLYRPPLKATTILLWTGPALLAAIGAFLLARLVSGRRDERQPLTAEERARAASLIDGGKPGSGA